MSIAKLTDDELLRHVYVQLDPLTSTELERELLRRFEEYAPSSPLLDVLSDQGVSDAEKLADLLQRGHEVADFTKGYEKHLFDVLDQYDVEDTEALDKRLQLLDVLEDFECADADDLRKRLQAFDESLT